MTFDPTGARATTPGGGHLHTALVIRHPDGAWLHVPSGGSSLGWTLPAAAVGPAQTPLAAVNTIAPAHGLRLLRRIDAGDLLTVAAATTNGRTDSGPRLVLLFAGYLQDVHVDGDDAWQWRRLDDPEGSSGPWLSRVHDAIRDHAPYTEHTPTRTHRPGDSA